MKGINEEKGPTVECLWLYQESNFYK